MGGAGVPGAGAPPEADVPPGAGLPPGAPNDTDGAPGAKLTCGGPASRMASGISKNSSSLKLNARAIVLDGNDWTRRL